MLLIQDRTPEDVGTPGSTDASAWLALRGLSAAARRRERTPAHAVTVSPGAEPPPGFAEVDRRASLEEVRRRYADREDYLAEIAARTGRSILHELDDAEIARLVDGLRERLPGRTAGRAGPLDALAGRPRWSARLMLGSTVEPCTCPGSTRWTTETRSDGW